MTRGGKGTSLTPRPTGFVIEQSTPPVWAEITASGRFLVNVWDSPQRHAPSR